MYHEACLDENSLPPSSTFLRWSCPQHQCSVCSRRALSVGGIIFRCKICPQAFCDDHLPREQAVIIGENIRFQTCGQVHPKSACFIYCSPACVSYESHLRNIGIDVNLPSVSSAWDRLDDTVIPGLKRRFLHAMSASVSGMSLNQIPNWEKNLKSSDEFLCGVLYSLLFDRPLPASELDFSSIVYPALGEWRGKNVYRQSLSNLPPFDASTLNNIEKSCQDELEALATTFFRFLTMISSLKKNESRAIFKLLNIGVVLSEPNVPPEFQMHPHSRLPPACLCEICALFLTCPCPQLMVWSVSEMGKGDHDRLPTTQMLAQHRHATSDDVVLSYFDALQHPACNSTQSRFVSTKYAKSKSWIPLEPELPSTTRPRSRGSRRTC